MIEDKHLSVVGRDTQPSSPATKSDSEAPIISTIEHEYVQAALQGVLANSAAAILMGQIGADVIIANAIGIGRTAYKCMTTDAMPPKIETPVIQRAPG